MIIETSDYFEVSEDELLEDVEEAYHALAAFTQMADGSIYSDDEYIAGDTKPFIVHEFRELYRYAVGSMPFNVDLDRYMSKAVTFSMLQSVLSESLESKRAIGADTMKGVIIQAYARYKIDHHLGNRDSFLMDPFSSLFGEQDMEGMSILQLAYLARMKQQSVRNKLSSDSNFSLQRETTGKNYMNIADAIKWLGKQLGFSKTPGIKIVDDAETISVPVARDGSIFHAALKGRKGYTIGPKGSEIYIEDFDEALTALKNMPTPYWRRPSKSSGVPGIVAGIRWERRALSTVSGNIA